MAIPTGPQQPFDKDRSYGQEPGFVSRHAVKLLILATVLGILIMIWAFASVPDTPRSTTG